MVWGGRPRPLLLTLNLILTLTLTGAGDVQHVGGPATPTRARSLRPH
jgi:hypothetical protein